MAATIETGLVAYLVAQSSITSVTSTRIYPQILPQNAVFPALTYLRVATARERMLSGGGATGHASPLFQFDCWARSQSAVRDLSDRVRKVLDGYRGAAGSFRILRSTLENERDLYEAETALYRVSMDFTIVHSEALS